MQSVQANPIHLTQENFEQEVAKSKIPVVLDFWAPWCGPCRAISPVLEQLASSWAGKVKVAKLNVDEQPELAGAFRISSIPTLLAVKEGRVVDMQVGFAGRAPLEKLFDELAADEPVEEPRK